MITLVIETCTERAIVAVVEEGHCSFLGGLPFGFHNSRYLLPKIDECFECLGKKPEEIDLIAVGTGPGSYTGIRVGTTVAKALSYAAKIPLVGVSTLKTFLPARDGRFAALLDAKTAGAALIVGEKQGEKVNYLSEPKTCPIEGLGEELKGVEVIVGSVFSRIQPIIEQHYPGMSWDWRETASDPLHMTQLAIDRYKKGEYSNDGSLELHYPNVRLGLDK